MTAVRLQLILHPTKGQMLMVSPRDDGPWALPHVQAGPGKEDRLCDLIRKIFGMKAGQPVTLVGTSSGPAPIIAREDVYAFECQSP